MAWIPLLDHGEVNKISPHALKSMKSERDQHQAIAEKYKKGTLERWMADEQVKRLDLQIERIEAPAETKPQQEPFIPTGIPGGNDKAYGRE